MLEMPLYMRIASSFCRIYRVFLDKLEKKVYNLIVSINAVLCKNNDFSCYAGKSLEIILSYFSGGYPIMATAKEKKETTAKAVETAATEKTATPVTETATAKKPAAKTASKAKTATKTAAKAPAKAKTASKTTKTATKAKEEVFIQLGGNEITAEALIAKSKELAGVKTIKSVNVYVRPEINKVFYVINGDVFGDFDLY